MKTTIPKGHTIRIRDPKVAALRSAYLKLQGTQGVSVDVIDAAHRKYVRAFEAARKAGRLV
jgi:hypothetical protein